MNCREKDSRSNSNTDLIVVVNFLRTVIIESVGLFEYKDEVGRSGQVLFLPVGPPWLKISSPLFSCGQIQIQSLK